ncbi:PAS domain-containing protein [Temperatibacter marinus]|uniref:PAS domain-containing protein n=1 Tax=Temperatibacter marinus TaxID=1456591 RepID=A0AA52HB06_9PROT|nr:PAS domain-containing protein [Temperatibacter marinus]WND03158.1 PAS domain-containing protein [Temperatibacter marinus]
MEQLHKAPSDIFDKVIEAWKSWRSSSETIPTKKDIRPQALHRYLPHIVLMDYEGDGIARYTLIGEQVKELYARQMVNENTHNIKPATQEQIPIHRQLVKGINDYRCGIVTHRRLNDERSIQWNMKILSLPLAGSEGRSHFILAVNYMPDRPEDNSAWQSMVSFDVENTIITAVKRLDLGFGVFDFPSENAKNIRDLGIERIC